MFSFGPEELLRVKIPRNLTYAGETNIERQIGQFDFRFVDKNLALGQTNLYFFKSPWGFRRLIGELMNGEKFTFLYRDRGADIALKFKRIISFPVIPS